MPAHTVSTTIYVQKYARGPGAIYVAAAYIYSVHVLTPARLTTPHHTTPRHAAPHASATGLVRDTSVQLYE